MAQYFQNAWALIPPTGTKEVNTTSTVRHGGTTLKQRVLPTEEELAAARAQEYNSPEYKDQLQALVNQQQMVEQQRQAAAGFRPENYARPITEAADLIFNMNNAKRLSPEKDYGVEDKIMAARGAAMKLQQLRSGLAKQVQDRLTKQTEKDMTTEGGQDVTSQKTVTTGDTFGEITARIKAENEKKTLGKNSDNLDFAKSKFISSIARPISDKALEYNQQLEVVKGALKTGSIMELQAALPEMARLAGEVGNLAEQEQARQMFTTVNSLRAKLDSFFGGAGGDALPAAQRKSMEERFLRAGKESMNKARKKLDAAKESIQGDPVYSGKDVDTLFAPHYKVLDTIQQQSEVSPIDYIRVKSPSGATGKWPKGKPLAPGYTEIK